METNVDLTNDIYKCRLQRDIIYVRKQDSKLKKLHQCYTRWSLIKKSLKKNINKKTIVFLKKEYNINNFNLFSFRKMMN